MNFTEDEILPFKRHIGWHEGYRIWTVDESERLVPGVTDFRFRPGFRIEARCPKGKRTPCYHPCLGFGHGCGIYAVKKEMAIPLFGVHPDDGDAASIGTVTARVALWGRVIEHEFGYRAEKCYPLEFLDVRLKAPDDPRHARIRYFLEDAWEVPFRPPRQEGP